MSVRRITVATAAAATLVISSLGVTASAGADTVKGHDGPCTTYELSNGAVPVAFDQQDGSGRAAGALPCRVQSVIHRGH
ncbi:hypothetical protein FAM22021_000605 [Propionibacterium freudenreichii]|nr:hypothetical protein [Propionibacterium freudenreichii]CEH06957.1 Hypothetical protein PFCIRM135_07015 [Propionibacterium freudenreichii]